MSDRMECEIRNDRRKKNAQEKIDGSNQERGERNKGNVASVEA